jgi:hypothetical protein
MSNASTMCDVGNREEISTTNNEHKTSSDTKK